jgi:hypothetical protein
MMQIAGELTIVLGSLMLLASASLAHSRAHLGAIAERLARKARTAAAHGDTVSRDYLAGAEQLARSAERFRSDALMQTVSDAKVTAQFQRMAGDYLRFKEQVERANTRQAFADLNAVATPYQEVERELGTASRRRRLS